MPKSNKLKDQVDWSLTTWEGSRREQLRRWSQLPLEHIIAALEEMGELAQHFADMREQGQFRDLSKAPNDDTSGEPEK